MKEDRSAPNCGSAQGEPSQALSRRNFLRVSITGAAIAGAGGLASCMTGQPTTRGAGTTPKPVALYQDSPNKGRRCGGCKHFLKPNACEIVAGEISPDGWCRFYEPLPA
ncbi:MAG: twin-arginine translocation signal domain-containing protein [Mesorhizobium sp.]|uniref:twin-arginine translocation signal domain-containing protein n=1 Tax=Mesorhizobium sp. TaxID=1871066 RepID=UPI000FE79D5A|nr:twin-arginine translocation signal domain-containing protein [Mesorhizobium sp.]RWB02237.1 MAG: twin-arginine translocation signal domain-containing protein [Mesorhizobium sp.]RWO05210.1 MAG: twin-arginine translocation signal domain-containing protein [Mesorhizobium sp.]RWO10299.1 MAG: twin-arginine translocation signal domain-containing protein [Mesorhizobium sp.]RWO96375.1 MAG: twin-arginine translocation signal domain-containing protein [Mesorhizobium sp.]RWP08568.1 MAG: twin-arginine t